MSEEQQVPSYTQFEVLNADCARDLSEMVTRYLQEGWVLHGDLQVITREVWSHMKKYGETTVYSQGVKR